MATAPKPRRSRKPAGDVDQPVALPHPAAEEAERKSVVLPEAADRRWRELADEATRKRTRVEVRLKEGTSVEETAEGDLRGSFLLFATGRSGVARKIGETDLFGAGVDQLTKWVEAQAELGADALREELKAHGKRLALLGTRDVSRKAGQLPPIYLDFRDRILPLAWDNLVAAVTKERLEDFVRKVADAERGTEKGARNTLVALAEEARGLVPKEETDAD